MGLLAAGIVTLALFAYIFWPVRPTATVPLADRELEHLRERRDAIFDNLRDLNFEFLAGKHPPADYEEQRSSLEGEAAGILRQMDAAEAGGSPRPSTAR